jgi:hypothetical protein
MWRGPPNQKINLHASNTTGDHATYTMGGDV